MGGMRVVAYARVSTRDQRPEVQLEPLRTFCATRGFELVGEYSDHGVSGAKASRPELDRMLRDAQAEEFKAVVFWKLDRLGRSLSDLLAITGRLEALGVDIVSVEDGIDTSTPAGRLFFQMRGAFAEFERALIVERTRAGLDAARRRGKKLGRPRAVAGEKQERLKRLAACGRSPVEIARVLDISLSTARRELARLASRDGGRS